MLEKINRRPHIISRRKPKTPQTHANVPMFTTDAEKYAAMDAKIRALEAENSASIVALLESFEKSTDANWDETDDYPDIPRTRFRELSIK